MIEVRGVKVNKVQAKMLFQVYEQHLKGDAYKTSEWTSGSGKHTTAKAVPPFCSRVERGSLNFAFAPLRIKNLFKKNPKVRAFICIVDLRSAKKVLKEAGLI